MAKYCCSASDYDLEVQHWDATVKTILVLGLILLVLHMTRE